MKTVLCLPQLRIQSGEILTDIAKLQFGCRFLFRHLTQFLSHGLKSLFQLLHRFFSGCLIGFST